MEPESAEACRQKRSASSGSDLGILVLKRYAFAASTKKTVLVNPGKRGIDKRAFETFFRELDAMLGVLLLSQAASGGMRWFRIPPNVPDEEQYRVPLLIRRLRLPLPLTLLSKMSEPVNWRGLPSLWARWS